MMRIQLFRVLYWTLAEIGSVGAPLVSAVSIVEAVSGSNNNKVATTATAENFAGIAHTGCDRAHPNRHPKASDYSDTTISPGL